MYLDELKGLLSITSMYIRVRQIFLDFKVSRYIEGYKLRQPTGQSQDNSNFGPSQRQKL